MPDLDPTGHMDPDAAPRRVPSEWNPLGRPRGGQAGLGEPEAPPQATVDSVPSGAVDIHRELTVDATDGEIGQVRGVVVDPGGYQVTHVLLQRGHMGSRKEVAIPVGAVTKIGTMIIHLSLTRRQVKDLPPVDIDHPAG